MKVKWVKVKWVKVKWVSPASARIKEIIQHKTIRGKFSSVHPDLAAEGITKVEVGEEGLLFIKNGETGSPYRCSIDC